MTINWGLGAVLAAIAVMIAIVLAIMGQITWFVAALIILLGASRLT